MTVYTFEKGDSIKVSADGSPLGCVTAVTTEEKASFYEVNQLLQGESVKTLPLKREYIITVKRVKDGELHVDNPNDFVMTVKGKKYVDFYSRCSIVSVCEKIVGKEKITQIITVNAKTKRTEAAIS